MSTITITVLEGQVFENAEAERAWARGKADAAERVLAALGTT